MNPYYQLSEKEDCCRKILKEFGLSPEEGHIINGHVPVKLKDGETPVKAGGKLFVIDGRTVQSISEQNRNCRIYLDLQFPPSCTGRAYAILSRQEEYTEGDDRGEDEKAYNGRRHRSWKGTGSADRRFKGVGERLPGWVS